MGEEVITGMRERREQHAQATLREIETTLDERLARLRAQMLQDTALVSRARDWRGEAEGVTCPECGIKLKARGKQQRTLQTNGGQAVVLEREYGECPGCGTGFFPPG
jgi:YgiT-type zinc finger domain-containing protein